MTQTKEGQRFTQLPGILLGNVRSLRHKLEELQANVSLMHKYRNTHMMAFIETWLNDSIDDSTLRIEGFGTLIWLDRDKETTGKEHGGGVCVYIKESCYNTAIV